MFLFSLFFPSLFCILWERCGVQRDLKIFLATHVKIDIISQHLNNVYCFVVVVVVATNLFFCIILDFVVCFSICYAEGGVVGATSGRYEMRLFLWLCTVVDYGKANCILIVSKESGNI